MASGENIGVAQNTVLFAPLSAWGHINSCVQIAKTLQLEHNFKIIIITNDTWKGKLDQHGFKHETYPTFHLQEKSQSEVGKSLEAVKSQSWTDLVIKSGRKVMAQSSLEKISTFGFAAYSYMVNEMIQSDSEIKRIVGSLQENLSLILIDNYILSPSLIEYSNEHSIPWVRLRSASPVEINQTNLPPQNSGYSIRERNDALWNEFKQTQATAFAPLVERFEAFFKENCPSKRDNQNINNFMIDSPYLNLYLYPKCIDYTDIRPMFDTWKRINALILNDYDGDEFSFPLDWDLKKRKIFYIALGTFGSSDLELMTNLTNMLGEFPAYFVVCKGPHHSSFNLPPNICGERVLPQTKVLAKVDAVICHGGNATINECFYFGRPMILMPFFGDEYDNAQRIQEEGFGIRMDPYNFTKNGLFSAISALVEDEMINKMKAISHAIQFEGSGAEKAAQLIVELLINCK